ncbi:MAG: tetratricopeptide repeat protein [Deltaproteobacteria bacterium]|nr:tetratricopeptide repeat protein [Deltaproteobacteria bacterium]
MLLIAAVFPHLGVWNGGFSFDDTEFVEANASIRGIESAIDSFDEPFPPHFPELGRYRPLTNLSYAIQFGFWKANPGGYHRANLFVYFAIVLLVYQLGCRYLGSRCYATWLALLFAVHPAHCEAVDSIAGHSELLSLLFVLLSLSAFHRFVDFDPLRSKGEGWTAPSAGLRTLAGLAAAAFYVAALLSKESAIVLPGVFLAHLLIYHQGARGASSLGRLAAGLHALPYFFIAPIYLGVRWTVLGRIRPATSILGDVDFATHAFTVGRVFFEYLRLLVFPHPLQVDYFYQSTIGIQTSASLCGLLGWIVLAAMLLWLMREVRWAGKEGAAAVGSLRAAALFGALTFFAFLFPVSHVVPFQALMAERFLFAPSLGAALFAVSWLASLRPSIRTQLVLRRAPAICLALFAVLTALRAADWRDEVALWTSLAEQVDDDPRVHASLGRGYIKAGDPGRAAEALEESLRLDPNHIAALNNLAVLRLEAGDYRSARRMYRRVVDLDPDSQVAWTNLGVIETRLLRHADAQRYYERALEADPNHEPARAKLGDAKKMVAKASKLLAGCSGLDPDTLPLGELRDCALAMLVVGDFEEAARVYATLKLRAPQDETLRIPQLDFQLALLAQVE